MLAENLTIKFLITKFKIKKAVGFLEIFVCFLLVLSFCCNLLTKANFAMRI